MTKAPGGDDGSGFEPHTETRVGRTRAPTEAERTRIDALYRADSVLALMRALPIDCTSVEKHVAGYIDGYRPVARLKKKTALSTDDLRTALSMLRNRGCIELVGVVEATAEPWASDVHEYPTDATVPKGAGDVIPPHVMAEIEAMLHEEDLAKAREALDDNSEGLGDATTEMAIPDDD